MRPRQREAGEQSGTKGWMFRSEGHQLHHHVRDLWCQWLRDSSDMTVSDGSIPQELRGSVSFGASTLLGFFIHRPSSTTQVRSTPLSCNLYFFVLKQTASCISTAHLKGGLQLVLHSRHWLQRWSTWPSLWSCQLQERETPAMLLSSDGASFARISTGSPRGPAERQQNMQNTRVFSGVETSH